AALHRGEAAVAVERFHGVDAPPLHAGRQGQAGEPRPVVDQHRAGAALAAVTTGLGAGEPDDLAQVIEQQQVVGNRVDPPAAVQDRFQNPGHGAPWTWRRDAAALVIVALERDDFLRIVIPALPYCWGMIFSENRYPLFGIMR